MSDWRHRRVVVTGGAGFLGLAVVRRLEAVGAGSIFVPRSKDYDLRIKESIRLVLAQAQPETVLPLATSSKSQLGRCCP